MKAVFADTFYYLALLDPHDSFHERAVDVTRSLASRQQLLSPESLEFLQKPTAR
jgi:hypothetical protein